MSHLLIGIALFVCSLAFSESDSSHAKARASEIEAVLRHHALLQPPPRTINKLLQCDLSKLFDPDHALFTKDDEKIFSQLTCYKDYCEGKAESFDAILTLARKRILRKKSWLEAHGGEPLNLFSSDSVPVGGWKDYAEDEKELEARQRKLYTLLLLASVVGKVNPMNVEKVAAVQKELVATEIQLLEGMLEHWSKLRESQKVDTLLQRRLRCVDNYSLLQPKEVYRKFGSNAGLSTYPVTNGLLLSRDDDEKFPHITGVIPGSPASIAGGLKRGDLVTQATINGRIYDFSDPKELEAYFNVKEEEGLPFAIGIERNGKKMKVSLSIESTLASSSVVRSQDFKKDGKSIRLIGIPNFVFDDRKQSPDEDISTSAQVRKALEAPGNFDAVVLDLRGNAGGAVIEAYEIAAQFLPNEQVPLLRAYARRNGALVDSIEFVNVSKPGTDKPVFVLVDRESASASEMLALSLKESGRAVVVGERTYGKGIQQVRVPLSDGSRLKFTSEILEGIQGTKYHGLGLEPDIHIGYLAGISPDVGEKMQILDERNPQVKFPLSTSTHGRVNREALDTTRKWFEIESKRHPAVVQYQKALDKLRAIKQTTEITLNYEKAKQQAEEGQQAKELIGQLGGSDHALSELPGMTTALSVAIVRKYLRTLEEKPNEPAISKP